MASTDPVDLTDWKNDTQAKVMDIVKNQLMAKLMLMKEKWTEWKETQTIAASDGFVNFLVDSDAPFHYDPELDITDPLNTGPTPLVVHVKARERQLGPHPAVPHILTFLRTHTQELQDMEINIRLYLSLIAPPKRTAENLEASIQTEVGTRLDNAISFTQQFLGVIDQFSRCRASALVHTEKTADCQDTDQYVYEYDQVLNMSLTHGFIELHAQIVSLVDMFEVRTTCFSHLLLRQTQMIHALQGFCDMQIDNEIQCVLSPFLSFFPTEK